jgi:RNA-binding protein
MIPSKQRAYLRGPANDFPAIMQIGKGGLTENLIKTCSDALEARELIKLHILENSGESPREVAESLAEAVGADVVAVTGKKAILYRRSEKKPVIELPKKG